MNRLWVRSSIIVTGVILIMAALPFLFQLAGHTGLISMPQREMPAEIREILETLPPETIDNFLAFAQQELTDIFTRGLISAAVVGVMAGIWLSRTLAAPLQRLEEGAQAIAARELSHRVPVQGSREIQSVANSFNKMAAQLETAETLRQNMLADVAHELRHPVHILQGNLQAMLDNVYPLSKEEIARLFDQTRHLSTLVNDLHELSLAEAHQLPLHKQMTDIAQLVKETAVTFKAAAAVKQIDLRVELLGTLPKAKVDAARFRQVIHNLLDNALEHTPENGRVTVTVESQLHALHIRVQDTGSGIAPEYLPHVFDRFYRTDSARSRDTGGAGLGLAIVKAIIEAHDGRVTAASSGIGQGSAITVTLPQKTRARPS